MSDSDIQTIHRTGARLCPQCKGPDGCPFGLDILRFDPAANQLSCTVTCPPNEAGLSGLAHGGWICKILDEILGQRVVEAVGTALTAYLNVQFKGPVPIETPVEVTSWIAKRDDRKIYGEGKMVHPQTGALLATAEGLFIKPRHKTTHKNG